MIINKSILHILDFTSSLGIFSQKELDLSSTTVNAYIEKHLERIQTDSDQKSGSFLPNSSFQSYLEQYINKQINFIELSTIIGKKLYEQISHSDKLDSIDLIVVDFTNEDSHYLALLLLTSKEAYTHQVLNKEGNVYNEIIRHYAILPNTTQKIESYAIIRLDNFSVGFVDKIRIIDGKDVYVLPEVLLQCTSNISSKEAIKIISQITTKIAENHGINSAVVLSKAKNYLVENAEVSKTFSPMELGQEVFTDSEDMQNEFETQISKSQLPPDIKMERSLAIKTGKNHKIKTDTGIEITFPAEYFENRDYIEFINNPNGTISIELKNIGKILNK